MEPRKPRWPAQREAGRVSLAPAAKLGGAATVGNGLFTFHGLQEPSRAIPLWRASRPRHGRPTWRRPVPGCGTAAPPSGPGGIRTPHARSWRAPGGTRPLAALGSPTGLPRPDPPSCREQRPAVATLSLKPPRRCMPGAPPALPPPPPGQTPPQGTKPAAPATLPSLQLDAENSEQCRTGHQARFSAGDGNVEVPVENGNKEDSRRPLPRISSEFLKKRSRGNPAGPRRLARRSGCGAHHVSSA